MWKLLFIRPKLSRTRKVPPLHPFKELIDPCGFRGNVSQESRGAVSLPNPKTLLPSMLDWASKTSLVNNKRSWSPFLESPDNFSGPKTCFMFVVFAFKIKVSIILKMIKWNYQLFGMISVPVSGIVCLVCICKILFDFFLQIRVFTYLVGSEKSASDSSLKQITSKYRGIALPYCTL